MNYIHQLQDRNQQKNQIIAQVYNRIIDLESYLLSPKFWDDSKVETQDVLNYLQEMRFILLENEGQ